jgi:hypothetical protein
MTTNAATAAPTRAGEAAVSVEESSPGSDLLLAPGDEHAEPELYPRLWNISAGMLYQAVLRAEDPAPPEYVTVPLRSGDRDRDLARAVAVSQWNMLWEAAQFRSRLFDEDDLPSPLHEVADRGDYNIVFVPRTRSRYHECAPLYHLLPRTTVERHGLPLLRGGQWPFMMEHTPIDLHLPVDFEVRLARAWASTVWRRLMPASPISGFSRSDPIRILAHNLDFWLPPVTAVIEEVLRDLPVVDKGIVEGLVTLQDGSTLVGAVRANPRMGSDLWRGEYEAGEIVDWTVEAADATGRLRAILDAVRSHRAEDDFSDRWTYAREDFERKLHHKRSKIKVRFVELTDTIPVQGPESEVVGQIVCNDFLALLNERDREVVVLLSSGMTNLTEIADVMGYRNHSPISKRLAKIRHQAARFFDAC